MNSARLRRGLYAISQDTADTGALLDWATAVIDGGAVCLQYRDKHGSASLRRRQARRLADLCRTRSATFIVNDDVDLAHDCGADGVHLGEDDGELDTARGRLGIGALIGMSCYSDPQRAQRLADQGADYLAFGAFFASASKPTARHANHSILAPARALRRPLVAIGGITPDNGGGLIAAGADLLAVIAGLAGSPEQAFAAARRYAALFDTHSFQPTAKRSPS